MAMATSRPNTENDNSRLVELRESNNTTIGLTTQDPAQFSAPSAPKRYALPKDWEQHRERIRQLYLEENKPLKEVMIILRQDVGHIGSIKQYKNKLREWKFDTKYKRHQTSRTRNNRRPKRQGTVAGPSQASTANNFQPQFSVAPGHNSIRSDVFDNPNVDDNTLPALDVGLADNHVPQDNDFGTYKTHLDGHVDAANVADQSDPFAGETITDYLYFEPADMEHATEAIIKDSDASQVFASLYQTLENQDIDPPVVNAASTITQTSHTRQASLSPLARSLALSQAVGIRSGRSATPPLSIPERIFSLAQRHIETSFTYGIWKLDSSGLCTSMTCVKEDIELPETFFDLVRSAVLLFQQGSNPEAYHVVSKAFALVKPILKSGNVRALNFFWTSVVFLVQFGQELILVGLIKHIYDMANIILHPEHPVVQMFKLLTRIDVWELESLVHNTWQITADAFQKQLPKLHPEYVRHQCDLIFRVYGTRDAVAAEGQLRQLLKSCQEIPQTQELSHMTVLNALGYNFMNSKDWKQAVDIGLTLEERARLADDMDLLVYQIGGMEIQARAFNELDLIKPAVKCLSQATPLIAKQWGDDDPWRIELMVLQENWLRGDGQTEVADRLKADISDIAQRIDDDSVEI
ncbi:hypothetical protein ACHAPI_011221 [Fusarium lateritium]